MHKSIAVSSSQHAMLVEVRDVRWAYRMPKWTETHQQFGMGHMHWKADTNEPGNFIKLIHLYGWCVLLSLFILVKEYPFNWTTPDVWAVYLQCIYVIIK